MFDIGPGEMLVILLVGLLVIGPEKLPGMIREATGWLRDLRRTVAAARRDLSEQLGPELGDLDLRDLDPRHFVRKNVLDGLDDDEEPPRRRANGSGQAAPRPEAAVDPAPGFDPDTT